jgi:hypothetical protein
MRADQMYQDWISISDQLYCAVNISYMLLHVQARLQLISIASLICDQHAFSHVMIQPCLEKT